MTYNVSGLLVVDDNGIITACNHHFAMLTFGKPHSEVIGHYIDDVIPNFCREADMVKVNERNRNMTLSPVNNENDGSGMLIHFRYCDDTLYITQTNYL